MDKFIVQVQNVVMNGRIGVEVSKAQVRLSIELVALKPHGSEDFEWRFVVAGLIEPRPYEILSPSAGRFSAGDLHLLHSYRRLSAPHGN
jgi:hypothetical protein